MTDAEVTDKFLRAATPRYGQPRSAALAATLWTTPTLPSISTLPDLLAFT